MTPPSATSACVPPGLRIYAVGDVHGRADLLDVLHARIVAEVRRDRPARVVLVGLGDLVDRGPASRGVVEHLLAPLPEGWSRVTLGGNHEDMMLGAMDGRPGAAAAWLGNGARATLDSYYAAAGRLTPADDRAAVAGLADVMPPRHLRFLRGLKTTWRCGGYFFVHAGVRPGVPLDDQDPDDLRWIRRPFLDSECDFGAVVVHGHTIAPRPVERPNRIGVDTGAFAGGPLTAVVLEGATRRCLQASEGWV
ncbi:metallophosphoesterase [Caenispirillum bisanense]|uniref:Serine/threonine protein phosphatase 1 n=1 Tax=Caenispirillum bisanense TaxID=414052 RepID=A0A286GQ45_9PROT|nr:metallophosphoesterase [Caenispirillum bisanense]SOD97209.1 serine/threonine protein phosphatase 1 [Caenispirillum bisanense]